MILLLDNYDSFTYNLADYFAQLGIDSRVERNDQNPDVLFNTGASALVISPGPEVPAKAGSLMHLLDHFHTKIPVLGICLGHQAIGEYFGGRLIRAQKPMHGKISELTVEQDDPLFRGLPKRFDVVRYNSLILEEAPPPLEVTARDSKGEIMALRHRNLPVHGVQFHPEAVLTDFGLQILRNWVENYAITV